MLAFELCSCHTGKTHSASAFGAFAEDTVADGPDAIKSDGEEHPVNSAAAKATTMNFIQVTPVERYKVTPERRCTNPQ